ncbi:MAG: hypothetical protein WBD81_15940 [Collimonas pratensis]|uniref:hypothetical protein n=1 Tax=Collimonas pratensis TaxID=279113 RepID=UPI003C72DEE4
MTAALCAAFAAVAASADAAEIAFASRSDFTEISLNIRDTYNANPDQIVLDVTLSQDAQQRMLAATTAALEQDLTLLIDGKPVSTTHVKNAIDAPQLQIAMSRQLAIALLPNLLGVSNDTNSAANSAANPSAIPPAMPSAVAATMPAPVNNPEPLFAAPPVEAQPQQVVPPTVTDSAPEATAAMPVPEPGTAMPPMLPLPAVPPDLGAAPVAEPAPSALPQEAAMAPAVVAVESPAPPLPLVPALPQVPRWATGAWLPTSATPSPYAEIYTGDAIAISAHGINALTCNQARTHVLESSPQQVRLEIDRGNACVINKIAVGQLRISPSATPGKVVISLYSPGDDMNGAPAIEGSYQRKP